MQKLRERQLRQRPRIIPQFPLIQRQQRRIVHRRHRPRTPRHRLPLPHLHPQRQKPATPQIRLLRVQPRHHIPRIQISPVAPRRTAPGHHPLQRIHPRPFHRHPVRRHPVPPTPHRSQQLLPLHQRPAITSSSSCLSSRFNTRHHRRPASHSRHHPNKPKRTNTGDRFHKAQLQPIF